MHAEVRAERLWRGVEGIFDRLNVFARSSLPREMNPFAQTGAVANTTFLIALVTGILLLFWYDPSVHQAYASVERMSGVAAFLRSLHRYSSDACMLFVLVHGLQVLGARKFAHARWLGWISGVALLGFLWLDGWTGYWLVWDERARQIALGTARIVDALPIFPEPLLRSFLTDESVNSLLFFVVFFIHMMIPLAMGILLWVHVMRLNKARFLTNTPFSAVITAALALLSILVPALSEGPAQMLKVPEEISIDWYYVLPALMTDRIQGGVLAALALGLGGLVFSVPWVLAGKRPLPAQVDAAKCNGCTLCYHDCPYNAITMMPNGRGGQVAFIDPSLCTGCGICVGSCDPAGISHTLSAANVRKVVNRYAAESAEGQENLLAFICTRCSTLRSDGQGRSALLPGYRIIPVPCIGWVHMLLVERAVRRGARGVLLAGCDADPSCRLGANVTKDRLTGEREPALRTDRVSPERVHYTRIDRLSTRRLVVEAVAFRAGFGRPTTRIPRFRRWAAASSIAAAVSVLTVLPATAPYPPVRTLGGELVVSFKHAGRTVEKLGTSEESQDDLLPHMRRPENVERVRMPVRLRVSVDRQVVHEKSYQPGGLFKDGASLAIETIPMSSGEHLVEVALGDSGNPDEWAYKTECVSRFESNTRTIVLFEPVSGFSCHGDKDLDRR